MITVVKREDDLAIMSPLFDARIFACEIHQRDLKLQIILCIFEKYMMCTFFLKINVYFFKLKQQTNL